MKEEICSLPRIYEDIVELGPVYRVRITRGKKLLWKRPFYSLTIHQWLGSIHFQLDKPRYLISGTALPKLAEQLDHIVAVETKTRVEYQATLGLSSANLGKRFSDVAGSDSGRWVCRVPPPEGGGEFDLIARLKGGGEVAIGSIEFSLLPPQASASVVEELRPQLESIAASRKKMLDTIAGGRDYIMAGGNARSGTTALGLLIQASPDISMGLERFNGAYEAHLFEPDIFFQKLSRQLVKSGFSHEELAAKHEKARYIGDKKPNMVQKGWRMSLLNIPAFKVIYIFREVEGVAASYEARAKKNERGWAADRGFRSAVEDWNKELRGVPALAQAAASIYFLKYEDIYGSRPLMEALFQYLGLDPAQEEIDRGIEQTLTKNAELRASPHQLLPEQREFVMKHADLAAYDAVHALYQAQRQRQGPAAIE
ncbi:hypothetical protein EY643_00930 [Halioglobus maricola]|uniref:Sulfotransferase domain-containing protein n=1 Tax=Halioglobus maricola TaxID=2601894 RepID=A0A5P9NFH2_9GAMM|nr:sulfotransferase [Halioglobus maricola]QFU74325.1 hypothetical protein EY643_00930 [Halioglobus maricola]